jgi:hypothetical protein
VAPQLTQVPLFSRQNVVHPIIDQWASIYASSAHPIPRHCGHSTRLKKGGSVSGVFPVPLQSGQTAGGSATLTSPRPSQAGQLFCLPTMPLPLQVTQFIKIDGTSMTFLFWGKPKAYTSDLDWNQEGSQCEVYHKSHGSNSGFMNDFMNDGSVGR